uniref:Fibronectin type III and SPRY domain containing 2 n=1 Tax=Astyanax mexicanus TaxID=7994 RepID=A0A3B1JQS3_ASTMX
MDVYGLRGPLQAIAEEMAVSEEEEAEGDEEAFVVVRKRPVTSDPAASSDMYCSDCGTPTHSGQHTHHRVVPLPDAVILNICVCMYVLYVCASVCVCVLQENFGRQEQNLEQHYSDVLQTLAQRNSENSTSLQDQKKQKLEALYGQLLACGSLLDTGKELIENAQELHRCTNRNEEVELKVGVSMEFTTPPVDLTVVKQMMESINVVPAPSAPVMNPQVVNSATTSSLRVCWSLFSDDTVDFYQLYCPVYMTVPSPPIIRLQECLSCLEAALVRWDSGNTNPVESYTLELSEADTHSSVTESIVAIPTCECLVQLQPWKRYVIHIRAVNIGGASERSPPITISSTGTFFPLLKETAHPSLSVSPDGFTMFYLDEDLPISEMVFSDSNFSSCVAVLGDLIPIRGQHYWEVEVDEWAEYRVGVAYEDTQRTSYLGANATSWCMRHIRTPSRHKYEFLHNGWSADVRITVQPLQIGVFLDYERGILSFYNAHLHQHLHTFTCCFHHYVLPCFALDKPGALTLQTGLTTPKYITHP